MYGIEDARISVVDGRWYMTACAVSPERHCTVLYTSDNGLDYTPEGIVLDHQNKDMLVFEGKVGGKFMALTRPTGGLYFAYPEESPYVGGPSIYMAQSPDALHWKPLDRPGVRARKGSQSSAKVGGGTPPVPHRRGMAHALPRRRADRGGGGLSHLLGAARRRRSHPHPAPGGSDCDPGVRAPLSPPISSIKPISTRPWCSPPASSTAATAMWWRLARAI